MDLGFYNVAHLHLPAQLQVQAALPRFPFLAEATLPLEMSSTWVAIVPTTQGSHVYLDEAAHRSLHWTLGVGALAAAMPHSINPLTPSTPHLHLPTPAAEVEVRLTFVLGGTVSPASLQSLKARVSAHTTVTTCTIWCAVPPTETGGGSKTQEETEKNAAGDVDVRGCVVDPAEHHAAERAALDKLQHDCEQWLRSPASHQNESAVVSVSSAGAPCDRRHTPPLLWCAIDNLAAFVLHARHRRPRAWSRPSSLLA